MAFIEYLWVSRSNGVTSYIGWRWLKDSRNKREDTVIRIYVEILPAHVKTVIHPFPKRVNGNSNKTCLLKVRLTRVISQYITNQKKIVLFNSFLKFYFIGEQA